jgi:hypothetical protein
MEIIPRLDAFPFTAYIFLIHNHTAIKHSVFKPKREGKLLLILSSCRRGTNSPLFVTP